MTRGLQDRDIQPRKVQRCPFGVGIRVAERPGGEIRWQSQILGAQPDLTAGVRRQIPDSPHVVKMPVGQ